MTEHMYTESTSTSAVESTLSGEKNTEIYSSNVKTTAKIYKERCW